MERIQQKLKWDQQSEIAKTVFLVVLVITATLGGYGIFMLASGTTSPLVVVTSSSMEPTLYPGDMLVLQGRTAEQIQVGDIVVYQDDWYTDAPVVHRVVEIQEVDGTYYYFTKGDNEQTNPTQDPGNRTINEIVGVMVLRVPQIGNVSLFLRTPVGIALMVVLFILIIFVPEFIGDDEEDDEGNETDGTEQPAENG